MNLLKLTQNQLFNNINVKTYTRKENQKKEIGFIADDVKNIIDGTGIENLTSKFKQSQDDENEYLALSYSKMTCVLWGVVKSQKNSIDKLKTQLRKQTTLINELVERMNALHT